MRFDILTLFPDMVKAVLGESIIGRATENKKIELNYINIRDFADNRHNRVDDYPYGGGSGMVMQPMPIYNAYMSVAENVDKKPYVIYMSPQGKVFTQNDAVRLSQKKHIVLLIWLKSVIQKPSHLLHLVKRLKVNIEIEKAIVISLFLFFSYENIFIKK